MLELKYYWPSFLGFGAVLLWNLWIAPYKLLEEQVGRLLKKPQDRKNTVELSRKEKMLQDLEVMSQCVGSILARSGGMSRPAGYQQEDALFRRLKTRYTLWFPERLPFSNAQAWIDTLIGALDKFDFDQAKKIAEKAAEANDLKILLEEIKSRKRK